MLATLVWNICRATNVEERLAGCLLRRCHRGTTGEPMKCGFKASLARSALSLRVRSCGTHAAGLSVSLLRVRCIWAQHGSKQRPPRFSLMPGSHCLQACTASATSSAQPTLCGCTTPSQVPALKLRSAQGSERRPPPLVCDCVLPALPDPAVQQSHAALAWRTTRAGSTSCESCITTSHACGGGAPLCAANKRDIPGSQRLSCPSRRRRRALAPPARPDQRRRCGAYPWHRSVQL